MYHTPAERLVQDEGQRLLDMYAPDTKLHTLGKTLLRFCSRRSKMLKLLSQLTWLIKRTNPELENNIAYQEAVNLLKAESAEASDWNQAKVT